MCNKNYLRDLFTVNEILNQGEFPFKIRKNEFLIKESTYLHSSLLIKHFFMPKIRLELVQYFNWAQFNNFVKVE